MIRDPSLGMRSTSIMSSPRDDDDGAVAILHEGQKGKERGTKELMQACEGRKTNEKALGWLIKSLMLENALGSVSSRNKEILFESS